MINVIDGNLFDSKANFIVHQVNCQGTMGSGIARQVADQFPHVESEYLKYLRHCDKNHQNALGTCQYVPVDVWALTMTDTMKNNNITAYDIDYQYIVNMFGQNTFGDGLRTDLKAVKKAMADIRDKAQSIGATVAMSWKIGSYTAQEWEDVYTIIKKTFGNSDVDVEIWRYDLG